jgi:exodeoxyribonuclease-5
VVAAGGEVALLDKGPVAARIQVQPCQDRATEVLAAARWAAARLAAEPACRLAIVVPDLAALRRPLMRALDAELQPAVAWGADMPRRLLTFSLGEPLARYAVGRV